MLLSYSRGDAVPTEPVRLEWGESSKTPSDVVWIGATRLIVSARFIGALVGFTGWRTFPVEVYDGRGDRVPGYEGLAITGRCGRVVNDLSRTEGKGAWTDYVGLLFSPETWDGSDVFSPHPGPGPIATVTLREALRRAKITNLRVIQLPKVRMNKEMIVRWHRHGNADPPPR